jgi:hypothetical protein
LHGDQRDGGQLAKNPHNGNLAWCGKRTTTPLGEQLAHHKHATSIESATGAASQPTTLCPDRHDYCCRVVPGVAARDLTARGMTAPQEPYSPCLRCSDPSSRSGVAG